MRTSDASESRRCVMVAQGNMSCLSNRSTPDSSQDDHRKKMRILKAAARLFAEKGFAGASTREIVADAGVTKPVLYYYFKNKEDLYIQLIDASMELFREVLDRVLAEKEPMRERLFCLYTSVYHLFNEDMNLLSLVNLIIYGPRGSAPQYDFAARYAHLERVIWKIVESGIAEGELVEDRRDEVMLLLMGVLRSMLAHLLIGHLSPLRPDDVRRVIDAIFEGAGTRAG